MGKHDASSCNSGQDCTKNNEEQRGYNHSSKRHNEKQRWHRPGGNWNSAGEHGEAKRYRADPRRYFIRGRCNFGDKCRYSHAKHDRSGAAQNRGNGQRALAPANLVVPKGTKGTIVSFTDEKTKAEFANASWLFKPEQLEKAIEDGVVSQASAV